jgi:hypothetical protein
MKSRLVVLIAAAGFAIPAIPAFAHHSFAAEYDAAKPVKITGSVAKLEWTNPHARFYIDAKDAKGNTVQWNFELASPNVLSRNGWTRHSLKEGDMVTVEGSQAKDGAYLANARTVILADGKKIFAGSATDQEGK